MAPTSRAQPVGDPERDRFVDPVADPVTTPNALIWSSDLPRHPAPDSL